MTFPPPLHFVSKLVSSPPILHLLTRLKTNLTKTMYNLLKRPVKLQLWWQHMTKEEITGGGDGDGDARSEALKVKSVMNTRKSSI